MQVKCKMCWYGLWNDLYSIHIEFQVSQSVSPWSTTPFLPIDYESKGKYIVKRVNLISGNVYLNCWKNPLAAIKASPDIRGQSVPRTVQSFGLNAAKMLLWQIQRKWNQPLLHTITSMIRRSRFCKWNSKLPGDLIHAAKTICQRLEDNCSINVCRGRY